MGIPLIRKEAAPVAVVPMRKSDLSGKIGEDNEFGRLVVKGHPAVDGARVLDVLPEEVSGLKTVEELIELEYTGPGASGSQTLMVRRSDFDKLAPDMAKVLVKAPQRAGRRRGNET
jgi:hypothetical protein